jgi:hypothetical protein
MGATPVDLTDTIQQDDQLRRAEFIVSTDALHSGHEQNINRRMTDARCVRGKAAQAMQATHSALDVRRKPDTLNIAQDGQGESFLGKRGLDSGFLRQDAGRDFGDDARRDCIDHPAAS